MIKITVPVKGYDGAVLRDVRIKAGITQKQVAETTGIPRARISSMERGNLSISEQDAHTLSRCLNITPDALRVTAVPEDSIPLSDDYSTIELPVSDDLFFSENDMPSLYYEMLQKIYDKYERSGVAIAEIIKAFIMPSCISLDDTITIGEGIARIEVFHGELFLYTLGKHVLCDKQLYAEAMIARIAEEDWKFIESLLPVALRCEEILDIAKRSFLAGKLNSVEGAWDGY